MLVRTLVDASPVSYDSRPRRSSLRVLLLADTHIGIDKPRRPRIERRRRGDDFMVNFNRALRPALRGEVDLVVHGGDLLFRCKVPPGLVEEALTPLVAVAETGVPVYLVPGNHERSRIPRTLLSGHRNLHIFHEPLTFLHRVGDIDVALVGFPFVRRVGEAFDDVLAATGWRGSRADVRLLCMHQTVEGAQVGPSDFTFRKGQDVVSGSAIPSGFGAVVSGHIHRGQTLTHDLGGRSMTAPVVYPGSVERTSFAECDEPKHYVILELRPEARTGGALERVLFEPLPARPMVTIDLVVGDHASEAELDRWLRAELRVVPDDAVVRVRVPDLPTERVPPILSAPRLRELVPPTANVSVGVSSPRRTSSRRSLASRS